MSQYYRNHPDEPIRHCWITGGRHIDNRDVNPPEPTGPAPANFPEDEIDDDGGDERPYCCCCNNTGTVDCLCGGDFCVCDNYGEKPCPKCGRGL